nr:ribonuclease H-like domain-containing protein [Tanacetum cinerariifolium]
MIENKSYLIDYQEIDGEFVAFRGNAQGCKNTGKSVLQMRNKKNGVLFTITECVVLSPDFKLLDESQVLLRVPRNNSMYSFDLNNVVPIGEDEVADDAGKKSTKVLRKENEVQDLAKEGDKMIKRRIERAQRNEFESMFGTEKDANGNMMFSPISATGSTYVYLGGSIPVNAATLPNVDPPTDPLMPGLEDTANTKIFSGAYNDEVEAAKADFNNFELSTVDKDDILLVHVYVDDIIFGSTKKSLCIEFKGLMHKKFQMSSMGELTFFLRLQVMQKDDGIFIGQDKYVADILKKFDFSLVKIASTLIETNKALLKDEEAEDVDVHL